MYILKLSEFVKYKTAIVVFDLFHGILPIQLQRRFTKYSSVHCRRQNKSFVIVQVRTNVTAMCLSLYVVKYARTHACTHTQTHTYMHIYTPVYIFIYSFIQ